MTQSAEHFLRGAYENFEFSIENLTGKHDEARGTRHGKNRFGGLREEKKKRRDRYARRVYIYIYMYMTSYHRERVVGTRVFKLSRTIRPKKIPDRTTGFVRYAARGSCSGRWGTVRRSAFVNGIFFPFYLFICRNGAR